MKKNHECEYCGEVISGDDNYCEWCSDKCGTHDNETKKLDIEVLTNVLTELRIRVGDGYLGEAMDMVAPLLLKELKIIDLQDKINLLNKQNENNKNK